MHLVLFREKLKNKSILKNTMKCSYIALTRDWHALVIDGAAVLNKTVNFIYQNNPRWIFVFVQLGNKRKMRENQVG